MSGASGAPPEEVMLARAYLLRVAEPPAPALRRFAEILGAAEAARRVRLRTVPDAVAAETAARCELDLAEQDLAEARRCGARLLVPEAPDWPAWPLCVLDTAGGGHFRFAGSPLALWVRGSGDLALATERSVAIVGARAASGYGEHVAAEFGHDLARDGFTVASGAAYGVDGSAHRGALAAGGMTIAVLGSGVDVDYPAGNARLLKAIAEAGLLLSEYPPGTPPARHRFLVRNRLIAALSAGTVVVEAGRRSGARNTAATARGLGRPVLAVPGSIHSATSVGCHELVRDHGADLALCAADVIEAVGSIGADLRGGAEHSIGYETPADDETVRVRAALGGRRGRSAERLALESGVPIGRVRALLTEWELDGLAEGADGVWRLRSGSPRRVRRGDA
jgi:DNA processing protein